MSISPLSPNAPKGWFVIPGVQEGERTLTEALKGFEFLRHELRGHMVLDLGCAEGLVGHWCLTHGAKTYDGIDVDDRKIETGRKLADTMGFGSEFMLFVADLNAPEPLPRSHDIVLCLSILHKLSDPFPLFRYACNAARRWLVLRAPSSIVGRLYIVEEASAAGFKMIAEQAGQPWLGAFRRCT